jgi:Rrf2 family protein
MKFSTRTRYGLRFLIYLGAEGGDRFVQLGEISEAEGISQKYLEQIIRLLKPAGVLTSARGITGGYKLAVKPDEITLERLFEVLEGDLAPINCLRVNDGCERASRCPTLPMWLELEELVRGFLGKRTLGTLIEEAKKEHSGMMMTQ